MKTMSVFSTFAAVVSIAVLLLAGSAPSAVVTWDGGAGSLNWGDGLNWSTNAVPPSGSQIQFNGGAPPAQVAAGATVSLAGIATYGSGTTEVDLNNGAGFTIDAGVAADFVYWPTIKVQDIGPYNIRVAAVGRLAINGAMGINIAAGGSLTVDGGFTAAGYGTANVTQTGLGTMYLTGGRPANASSIQMIVRDGTLSTDSVNNLGTNYLAAQQNGRFEYTGTGAESKTGLLYWNYGSGTFDITSPTANLTFNVTGGDQGSGGGTFTKAGPGTLTLATSGANILLGKPVALSAGTLALQANGANVVQITSSMTGAAGTLIKVLPGGGTVRNDALVANWSANLAGLDVAGGGTFDLRGNKVRVDALTGSGWIINSYYQPDGAGITGETLTAGANNGTGTFAGVISGTGTTPGTTGQISLNKIGAGTQTLSGANTYTGTTNVSQGTLLVNGTHTGGGAYTVASGATLGGSGRITAPVIARPGSHVAPGNSPDMLRTGALTLDPGSNFDVELGPAAWDSLDVTGTVSLDGAALNFTLLGSFSSYEGGQYTLIQNDLADAVSGIFTGFPEGRTFELSGNAFVITYRGGTDSNDVVLTAVPEPATMLLLGLAATSLGGYLRRRRAA